MLGGRLSPANHPGLQTPVFTLSADEAYESEELVAICSAPQEKGALVFQFFQRPAGGTVSLLKQAFSVGNWSETRLVLREAGDRDMFCNYSIPMAPQAGSSNSSNMLHGVSKGTPPPPPLIQGRFWVDLRLLLAECGGFPEAGRFPRSVKESLIRKCFEWWQARNVPVNALHSPSYYYYTTTTPVTHHSPLPPQGSSSPR